MKFLITSLFVLSTSSAFAETVTIDFQSLEQVNDTLNNVGVFYSEDGYTLTDSSARGDISAIGWTYSGTLNNFFHKGSTALINDFFGITTLTKENGSAFNLNSIDLAGFDSAPPFRVTFIGIKSDASTITQQFTGGNLFSTYVFNEFTDLVSVEWRQTSPLHMFDNINLTSVENNGGGNPSAVPLPAALPLMASVLGVFGLARRCNKAKAA